MRCLPCSSAIRINNSFLGSGFLIESTSLFQGGCTATCYPTLFAWVSLLFGWGTCGQCEEFNLDMPANIVDRADVEFLASDEPEDRDNDTTGDEIRIVDFDKFAHKLTCFLQNGFAPDSRPLQFAMGKA